MKWEDVKPWISKIAPMLGTALGGPLGGAAGALLASALGAKDANPETISQAITNGTLTGDQILMLKKAEQDFKVQMAQVEINSVKDLEALAVDDRKSARSREVEVKDLTPRVLAYGITAGFFGLLAAMLCWTPPQANKDMLNILLGALGTAWISVMNYYFGSTAGSTKKTELLYKSTPKEDV